MPRKINQTLSEGLDGDVWQGYLANVRGYLRNVADWKLLSEESGVAKSTIRNIAYGRTRSPHAYTIYRLMTALGREKEFVDAVASDKPMTLDEAKRLDRNYKQRLKRKKTKSSQKAVKVRSAEVVQLQTRKTAGSKG